MTTLTSVGVISICGGGGSGCVGGAFTDLRLISTCMHYQQAYGGKRGTTNPYES